MVEMGKKTGGHFLWEPLRTELQDTFGALSHVSLDAVFSNINGHKTNPNALSDEEDEEGLENAQANPRETTCKTEKVKKQSKSKLVHFQVSEEILLRTVPANVDHQNIFQFDNLLSNRWKAFLQRLRRIFKHKMPK